MDDNTNSYTDACVFLCNNCGNQFKSYPVFLTHCSKKRTACAFKENELVINLELFTVKTVSKGFESHKLRTEPSALHMSEGEDYCLEENQQT